MASALSPDHLPAAYAAMLTRVLDLALNTAEAAGAEGNHRVALQAVREVTRIIALMVKMGIQPHREATGTESRKVPTGDPVRTKPPLAPSRQAPKRRDRDQAPPGKRARPERDLAAEIDKLRFRVFGEDGVPP